MRPAGYLISPHLATDQFEFETPVLTLGNGQIWLGTPPVVLQIMLVFFHFLIGKCLFAKNILTLAKSL